MNARKVVKKMLWVAAIVFAVINIVAFFHAYKFTHFSDGQVSKTKSAHRLTPFEKIEVLFTGIDNPRPAVSSPFLGQRQIRKFICYYCNNRLWICGKLFRSFP